MNVRAKRRAHIKHSETGAVAVAAAAAVANRRDNSEGEEKSRGEHAHNENLELFSITSTTIYRWIHISQFM